MPFSLGWRCRCGYPPNSVAHIIGYQQSAVLIKRHAYGPSECIAIGVDKPCKYINGITCRRGAVKGDKDYLIAAGRLTVPGAMLADKHSVFESRRQGIVFGEG